jgi:outer membrane protein OmpA-like peptidoglycan-associated protein
MSVRVLIVSLILGAAAPAWAERYVASLGSAEWQLERSPLRCRLRQPVPRYGEAVFETRAGGRQSFTVRARNNPMVEGPSTLIAAAPQWNPNREAVAFGAIDIAAGAEPLRLEGAEPQRLLDSLESGLAPQFSRPLRSDREQQAHLELSPLNFRPVYREYQNCVQRLLPVSFEQIATTTVAFPSEGTELTASARQQIDTMLRYVRVDRTVTGFALSAVSSDTPRRLENLALAKARAQQVQDYLLSRGAGIDLISSDSRGERPGERRSSANQRTVTIRLSRAKS